MLDLIKLGFVMVSPAPQGCDHYYTRCPHGWKPKGNAVEYVKYNTSGPHEYFCPGRDLNGRDDFRATFLSDDELAALLRDR